MAAAWTLYRLFHFQFDSNNKWKIYATDMKFGMDTQHNVHTGCVWNLFLIIEMTMKRHFDVTCVNFRVKEGYFWT
jgi:hypothetical protein